MDTDPRRICLVTETYPPEINGVALTLARLASGLRARGHAVSVVRPRQPSDGRVGGKCARDPELTRQRKLERLHHPAAYRPALVVQVRGEHLERVRAAAGRERRQHMCREAVRGEQRLEARDGAGISGLRDDSIGRLLDDVLVRRRGESPGDGAIARRGVGADKGRE